MPIHPFGSEKTTLTKSPSKGNKSYFSNAKATVEIIAWDVKNTKIKQPYTAQTKVHTEERLISIRTYNPVALELETDDKALWEGKNMLVQRVRALDVPLGLNKKVYEIDLR